MKKKLSYTRKQSEEIRKRIFDLNCKQFVNEITQEEEKELQELFSIKSNMEIEWDELDTVARAKIKKRWQAETLKELSS